MIRSARSREAGKLREIGIRGWETTYASFIQPENRTAYLNGEFWSIERLKRVLDDPDAVNLVAEIEGRVIGFITTERLPDGRYEVTRLYVDPDVRSRGTGSLLLTTALTTLRTRGSGEILVNAFGDNHSARRFYERHGFELVEDTYTCVGDQKLSDVWYAIRLDDRDSPSDPSTPQSYPRH